MIIGEVILADLAGRVHQIEEWLLFWALNASFDSTFSAVWGLSRAVLHWPYFF